MRTANVKDQCLLPPRCERKIRTLYPVVAGRKKNRKTPKKRLQTPRIATFLLPTLWPELNSRGAQAILHATVSPVDPRATRRTASRSNDDHRARGGQCPISHHEGKAPAHAPAECGPPVCLPVAWGWRCIDAGCAQAREGTGAVDRHRPVRNRHRVRRVTDRAVASEAKGVTALAHWQNGSGDGSSQPRCHTPHALRSEPFAAPYRARAGRSWLAGR